MSEIHYEADGSGFDPKKPLNEVRLDNTPPPQKQMKAQSEIANADDIYYKDDESDFDPSKPIKLHRDFDDFSHLVKSKSMRTHTAPTNNTGIANSENIGRDRKSAR